MVLPTRVDGVDTQSAADVNALDDAIGRIFLGGLNIPLDGQGAVIAVGVHHKFVIVPYACTITGWTLYGDPSGSIVLDLWKDTYANYPPTVADTITGSAKPTLTTTTKNTSTTLTGWTTTLTRGDVLRVNVDSATTITEGLLFLAVTRT